MNIPDAPWIAGDAETRIPIKSASGRTVAYAAIGRQDYEVANIIAAAPDYDKGARAFVEWAKTYGDDIHPQHLSAMENAFGSILRAAITKTEGTPTTGNVKTERE